MLTGSFRIVHLQQPFLTIISVCPSFIEQQLHLQGYWPIKSYAGRHTDNCYVRRQKLTESMRYVSRPFLQHWVRLRARAYSKIHFFYLDQYLSLIATLSKYDQQAFSGPFVTV